MAYLAKPAAVQDPTEVHLTQDIAGEPVWVAFDDYVFPWEQAGVSPSAWLADGGPWGSSSGGWSE